MKISLRRTLLYYLPLATNILLTVYLAWQLWQVTPFERHSRVFMFALLYGLGGVVVAVSGVTAFFHATGQSRERRVFYAMALVNIIIPTVLLLLLLNLT